MRKNAKNSGVRVSIVIPSRNRCLTLKRVLFALEKQDCDRSLFEVIVVDDGSTDRTQLFLQDFSLHTYMNYRFLSTNYGSAGAARNLGIQDARGDVIIFLDADTIPQVDLVTKHLKWQDKFDDELACIIGNVLMAPQLAVPEQARMRETEWSLEGFQQVDWTHCRTANTSIRRDLCMKIGGFNRHLFPIEDVELAYRLSQLGAKFYYDDQIIAVHYHPMGLASYLEKGEMSGRAAALWYIESPELRARLVYRYGVWAPETLWYKRIKYIIRAMIVNRFTISAIMSLGQWIRRHWFALSERLYKCSFRYKTRRAFKESLSISAKLSMMNGLESFLLERGKYGYR